VCVAELIYSGGLSSEQGSAVRRRTTRWTNLVSPCKSRDGQHYGVVRKVAIGKLQREKGMLEVATDYACACVCDTSWLKMLTSGIAIGGMALGRDKVVVSWGDRGAWQIMGEKTRLEIEHHGETD
jgi:hypothetical protein